MKTLAQSIREALNLLNETPAPSLDFVLSELKNIMTTLVAQNQSAQTGDYDAPSGPNTTKFTTTVRGNIELKQNVTIPVSGFNRNFVLFVKIGSGVLPATSKTILNDFITMVNEAGIDFDGQSPIVTDSGKIYFTTLYGSSWGGFGVFLS